MLSLRSFARSAPRAIGRMTAASARQSAVARPSTFIKTSALGALQPSRAAFSTTVFRRAADGETDDELSAKLESEIQYEDSLKASEQEPASIKDFLDNSPFELIDTPGEEVVKLVRTFGEEKITVSFSISDITGFEPSGQDDALEDEELGDDYLQGNKQNQSRSAVEEDLEDDIEDLGDGSIPINLNIIIEKPGKTAGALSITATAEDGNILVDEVSYFDDAKVARVDSPDSAQKGTEVYLGPPYGTLDEELHGLVERFLEERGITQALAVFVPDYADVKEQREYVRWLANVKSFIDV